MTIAAQHVRTALSHLRSRHPAWKSILKAVGPFTVRIERQPAWWLTKNLHCRSFRDFAAVRNSLDSQDLWPEDGLMVPPDTSWDEVRRQFWTEVKSAQLHGRLDLTVPSSPAELVERTAALTQLLERYGSTIGDRFPFYCWGMLDSWPNSDLSLRQVVTEQFFEADTNAAIAPLDSLIDAWSPYRSIAAWYLEQWAMRPEYRSACSNPI